MATVLVIDRDPRSANLLAESYSNRLKDGGTKSDVFQVTKLEEAYETIRERAYDVVLIDEELMDQKAPDFVNSFREKLKVSMSPEAHIVALGHKEDKIMHYRYMLAAGYVDYLTKPLDRALTLQKIDLLTTRNGVIEKQLYSMKVTTDVNVASVFSVEEISEFGLTIKSDRAFKINDVVSLYCEAFKQAVQPEVLARLYKVTPHPVDTKLFQCSFVFVGVGQSTLKSIRTWMRTEYVRKKQSA
jgi:DNA-binding response OmpR family regulator